MIRIVVLVLLAANLLYFGWAHWVGRDNAQLTAVAAAPPKPKPPAPVVPPPPPPCATLGPFADELLANQAQQKLEGGGWGVLRRSVAEKVHEGWWVYVVNDSSNRQARTLNALRRAGIQDAFAMPDDPEFRVSVGIFSEENRAEDRAVKVQRLQLDAQVTERVRDHTAIWLDIPGLARETLGDGRLATIGVALDKLRVEGCPALADKSEPAAAAAPEPAQGAETATAP